MAQQDEIQAALKVWRDGLIGLSRQSALVKFRAPKGSSLRITSPSADDILKRIQSGVHQELRGTTAAEDSDGSTTDQLDDLRCSRPEADVGPIVRNLMRRAQTEFLDRGITVLYLAFGMLEWQDIDGTEMNSPILLVPVQLIPDGPKGTPRITQGEDDPVVNPALALRLREVGIELPTAEHLEMFTIEELLVDVRHSLGSSGDIPHWKLHDTTHLALFSFAKEAMFKDLQENEAEILAHPVVQALATSDVTNQSAEFQFDAISANDIDRLAPPESTPLVLDADSSQRAAVAAAIAGRTFVLDGPPGTGKSQTIANAIGALLHANMTILFVSEKIAALEVVRNRLSAAGLGSFILELHSHKTSRKEVAAELLNTLDTIAKPPGALPAISRHAAKEHREQLNAYAAAMNETREPLNISLHQAFGRYAALTEVPTAPVPERTLADLAESAYFQIQASLTKLARAWRPAAQGSSFLWRDIIDAQSLEVRLYQAATALEELRDTSALNAELASSFNLTKPSDSPSIHALTEHQHRTRPAAAASEWLTADSIEAIERDRDTLHHRIQTLTEASAAVTSSSGAHWTEFPGQDSIVPSPGPISTSPTSLDLTRLTASSLLELSQAFERDATMLDDQLTALSTLADNLGLEPVVTFTDAERIIRLVSLQSRVDHADRRWFTAQGLPEAWKAAAYLRERVEALGQAEGQAAAVFTASALSAPMSELHDRFTNQHKGFKKLSASYRADKRTLAQLLVDPSDIRTGIDSLQLAVSWLQEHNSFKRTARKHGGVLGTHWNERSTDFDRIERSLNVVDEILGLTGDSPPAQLVAFLTNSERDHPYQTIVTTARTSIDTWTRTLAPSPAIAGRPELLIRSIADARHWLSAHASPAHLAAQRVSAVNSVTGGDHTLTEADGLLELVGHAEHAKQDLHSAEHHYRDAFGRLFDFEDTDMSAIDTAIEWTRSLRDLNHGPLSQGQLAALERSQHVANLVPAYTKWSTRRDRIIKAFAATRHSELHADLDDFAEAQSLISELQTDTVGQQEWFAYHDSYTELASVGLDTAVDFCIEQNINAGDVPDVVNRALLRGWSDEVLRDDPRLRPMLATDRNALVDEYRALDRSLITAATADIITAANLRRPHNTTLGESGVIRREGGKQRRHKSVKELLSLTRTVSTGIKPVFMMSPLAVSQYLPTDMKFDVVIFDEASQVTPGDAINCIYRGRSLILAGDDKQLPPTSFFERHTDEDDTETDVKDFQSVLELAKAAGAFNSVSLKWHYRSRHEDLIAFSNYKFYEGKLVTFPSAQHEGADIGVEFFHVDGVYQRGGGSHNPIEAQKVAERVIEHYTLRPSLTLGVVTFSVAQADAVQNAIDEARTRRRDLDRHFDSDDRLDGFFIRALEQVQGDERDVIIFSVGYGPDEAGKISTNFGALNKDKGWRRLNVGITRARQRVEVVASMYARQIPPSQNENVEYFRNYLDYAERGSKTLAVPYSSTGLDPESPFEESVIEAIRSWGFTVEPQVGAAGYRIDIGVRHPDFPGMFAIGIECDGYQYHSAPAARDRDRLRDQILIGLGWRLHRIWGTAWYRDRSAAERELRKAIESAISTPIHTRNRQAATIPHPLVETEQVVTSATPTWTSEYSTAPFQPLKRWVEPGAAGSHTYMVDALEALVEHEAPIHLETVYERLRSWWAIGRVGPNIRSNIDLAIEESSVQRDGQFLMMPGVPVALVRTPTPDVSRKAEQIHLDELALAVRMTARDVGAASRADLVQGVARVFGWTRTGALVERRLNEAIVRLIDDGELIESDETLIAARPSTSGHSER